MDQKQLKQVKKYRILKVLFYFLGFPLFIFTTFAASIKYMGRDPYVGSHLWEFPILETQVFNRFEEMISAPALYGVWVVLAIWVLVSIVHIILTKVCKNQRSRMLIVVIVILVSMLGTMFGMDYAFDKNISAMIDDVNNGVYTTGVTVENYQNQLSYYNRLTSDKNYLSYFETLYESVERLEKVYAVNMFGYDKCGVAGDMGNTVAYYDELIDDDGNRGVDISFELNPTTQQYDLKLEGDGEDGNDHVVVRLAPNSKGQLQIGNKVFTHYFYIKKTPVTHDTEGTYVWYLIDMYPNHKVVEKNGTITGLKRVLTDGAYGEGIYNPNGLFADGYIPSFYNVLEILEDYYAANEIVSKILAKYGSNGLDLATYNDFDTWHAATIADAELRREEYYTDPDSGCSPFLQELYKSESTTALNRFSLTRGRLDALLAEVGALLGDNALFDLLLKSEDGLIASVIGGVLDQLETGMDLGSTLGISSDVYKIIGDIFGKTCTGLVIQLVYTTDDPDKDHFILLISNSAINVDDIKSGSYDKSGVILDLDFSNEVLGLEDDERFLYKNELGEWAVNTDYAFDLDHLSKLLSNALTYVFNELVLFDSDGDGTNEQTLYDKLGGLLTEGTLGTILGIVGGLIDGLDISSAGAAYSSIANLIDGLIGGSGALAYNQTTEKWTFDLITLIMGLLDSLYYYQTPAIKTVYEFYVDPEAEEWEQEAQKAFADYDRAYFTGSYYCSTIGSTVIGENLGGNNDMNATYKYTADMGLTDLASVQQLKLDLSYKPVYYPLFTARDLILVFTGVVILFYFLSFVAAQKEREYANGTLIVEDKKSKKKSKKSKKEEKEPIKEETNNSSVNEEAAPQEENVAEEIKEESVEEDAPKEETITLDSVDSTEEVG